MSLRVVGDDLDPAEITALLGRPPTFCTRKGDVRPARSRSIVARSGSWHLSVGDDVPGDLNAKIMTLFDDLTGDLTVWTALSRRYRCDVFCGLFLSESNEGTELFPEVLSLLCERGLRLGLDIYGSFSE
ncbi:DUF4279 domain-containing protein [Methylobacterium sp. 77]|uniref:DUF4279 domain-containing protein n=1 Tax=Methylobacterium sp. 77 TaxID=1101192 RepID=UPI00037DB4A1|nr:DUF4279 domain-containing protein [Methylobacterium sp. 77]